MGAHHRNHPGTPAREVTAGDVAALALLVAHHERFTLERFAGTHAPQLAFMRDRSNWIHVMCARQSGKSWGNDGILLDNALTAPRSTNLLLGIKGTGVRTNNWFPIWKPLCERYGVPDVCHNETEMRTTLPNGARVMFAGTDDLTNVRKYLGNRLASGVVIVDEAQDQPDSVVRYLLKVLLPPMLAKTSRVIISGVLPDVPAGYFYELAGPGGRQPAVDGGWSRHEWGRSANVHTPEAMEDLRRYLVAQGLSEDDPQVQRDWYMRRVWDLDATAYRYERARNGFQAIEPEWLDEELAALAAHSALVDVLAAYQRTKEPSDGSARHGIMAAEPHDGITEFSVALDPGSRDRFSIEVTGWGEGTEEVQQVFEWSSPRNAQLAWSHIGPVLGLVKRRFDPIHWRYDAGSSLNELDVFKRDYDVPAIAAAKKTDLHGQVSRGKDLLVQGRAKIMIGSALEEDLTKARWDKEARARQQWKWASSWHPDPSESWRYTLDAYFNLFEPQPSDEERAEAERRDRRKAHEKRVKSAVIAPADDEGDSSWSEGGDDEGDWA